MGVSSFQVLLHGVHRILRRDAHMNFESLTRGEEPSKFGAHTYTATSRVAVARTSCTIEYYLYILLQILRSFLSLTKIVK